jgi:hypothetical protein
MAKASSNQIAFWLKGQNSLIPIQSVLSLSIRGIDLAGNSGNAVICSAAGTSTIRGAGLLYLLDRVVKAVAEVPVRQRLEPRRSLDWPMGVGWWDSRLEEGFGGIEYHLDEFSLDWPSQKLRDCAVRPTGPSARERSDLTNRYF